MHLAHIEFFVVAGGYDGDDFSGHSALRPGHNRVRAASEKLGADRFNSEFSIDLKRGVAM